MTPDPGSRIEAFQRKHRVGLLTLLFTDIVGSVQLKREHGDSVAVALVQRHHALVREVLQLFSDAEEIETAGDSFLLVFARPSEAVRFAVLLQTRLRALAQETGKVIADRVGIHLGEVFIQEQENLTKLFGMQVDTCARIMGLAQGGQTLMTRAVFDNARQALRGAEVARLVGLAELQWLNHGPYLLKGIDEPVEVCEVREAGGAPATPPTSSEKAQRVAGEGELVLGWRPALDQKVPGTPWLLEEKLGEGGFGEVWAARHEKLKEKRVFKFCFRADRVRSLKREVTLFRLLKERIGDHPNIVKLYDMFFDEPPFYLVEEYVAGRDLRAWSEDRGGLANVPLETRFEIVARAADGLQAAHEAGVIHRDIKPGNILIAECGVRSAESKTGSTPRIAEGAGRSAELNPKSEISNAKSVQAKLSDFGIGQVMSEEHLIGLTRAGFTQTMFSDAASSGTGTQLYMAPELLAGKPASTRTDIYALGIVLYQLVMGDLSRPLTTDWVKQIQDSLLRADLERCFAGDPNERFGSAVELAKNLRQLPQRRAELERQQAEKAALERTAYRRGMMRTAGLAAVIVALVTGLALAALHQSSMATKEKAEASHLLYVADMNLAQQSWEQDNVRSVRALLDETRQSPSRGFEWYFWQGQMHLDLRTLRGHLAAVHSVAFSPDSRRIVTVRREAPAKVWQAASAQQVAAWQAEEQAAEQRQPAESK